MSKWSEQRKRLDDDIRRVVGEYFDDVYVDLFEHYMPPRVRITGTFEVNEDNLDDKEALRARLERECKRLTKRG